MPWSRRRQCSPSLPGPENRSRAIAPSVAPALPRGAVGKLHTYEAVDPPGGYADARIPLTPRLAGIDPTSLVPVVVATSHPEVEPRAILLVAGERVEIVAEVATARWLLRGVDCQATRTATRAVLACPFPCSGFEVSEARPPHYGSSHRRAGPEICRVRIVAQ